MYLLYSTLLAVGMLLSLPFWLWQAIRHGKYRTGLGERLGIVPARLDQESGAPTVWIHAVSVGEVLAVSGLIAAMRVRFPQCRIVVSTTTDTGQKLARTRFGEANVFYFPMDFAFAIRPYLKRLHPQLIVLAETEFWPNFLRLAHQSGAHIAVVNARISDRSWPGYRRFRHLLSGSLEQVDLFLAQAEEDRTRLVSIGAPAERIQVTGNLKFDSSLPPAPSIVATLRASIEQTGAGPVLVCGSTLDDEESLLLAAFKNALLAHPRAVLLLAPRHPERFNEVAQLLEKLNVRYWRRSLWNGEPLSGGVLLLDTIGELASLYALADVAFVGGSLVPRGGHNIIEPAQHGIATITGNHYQNFRDIVNLFKSKDAVRIVAPAEFPLLLVELFSNPTERAALGRRAAETLQAQAGATKRTLEALTNLLDTTKTNVGTGL